jgi:NAD(P)-dependent dehydrogenase (short-subunit alcohol dehydrogenase family)
MTAGEFAGQVVLVTGAGGRIGGAICRLFAAQGAKVACSDVDAWRAAATADAILRAGGKAVAVAGDLTSEAEIQRIVAEATARLGPVDVLVNCAGIFPNTPVIEMDAAEWDRVYAVNVRAPMLLAREVARQMLARGAKGNIINISSTAGESARTGGSHYCGSKAALNILTHTLAIELGGTGIRVNSVSPGLVMDSVISNAAPPADPYPQALLKGIPMGRSAHPEEIASAVLYLADNQRASYVNGAILSVTGGGHAGRPHLPPSRHARASHL